MELRTRSPSLFTSCPPVNVEFKDLNYTIKGRGVSKQILKNLYGAFYSGELSAILGSSGSGKTTLLNILSGCTVDGISGNVMINGNHRQMNVFNKVSTYVMQENCLQPYLTLYEAMLIATAFKLGNKFTIDQRKVMVIETLNVLKLNKCFETRTEFLSGGEKKRLAIALEIVGNPSVIFLDEPMTGLDTVSIKQCMDIFQTLAAQGRTIVFTVHQPSLPNFQNFDQVYFIAEGMCIYNGSTTNISPFLSSINLHCPITHNPAEFVIELAHINKENLLILVNAIENGKINKRSVTKHTLSNSNNLEKMGKSIEFTASFRLQFLILFNRMMLQMRRNRAKMGIQIFSYLLMGFALAILAFGVGNNAEVAMTNYKLYLFVVMVTMYMHLNLQAPLFPFEIEPLKREYFSRWYGLKPYFLALTLRSVPLTVFLELMFLLIIYIMTDQPLEWERIFKFYLICLLVSFISEALGIAIGSVCSPISATIAATAVYIPCVFLAVHGFGYGQAITNTMKIVTHISYTRLAVDALHLGMFENRSHLDCLDEMSECFYKDPKHILRDVGVLGCNYWFEVLGLVGYMIMSHVVAYFSLRYRLSNEFVPTVASFITRIMRYK